MKNRMKIFLLSLALVGLILSTSCASSKTPTITTNSLPERTEDVAYSHTLEVQGGSPPYIWSVMGGELPIGLQLNPETGVISGTPLIALSAAFVTFQVTDNSKKDSFQTNSDGGQPHHDYYLHVFNDHNIYDDQFSLG